MFDEILLGAVQGITEWLPLSSKSYSIIVAGFFGTPAAKALDTAVWLHAGTLIAAMAFFRRELLSADRKLINFLLLATAASAVTGFPAYFLAKRLVSLDASLLNLIIGALLILTGFAHRLSLILEDADAAIFAGLAQGLAMIPGISRSAITVLALTSSGVKKDDALRLSFLMSIPAVLGLLLAQATLFSSSTPPFLGIAVAAIVGYFSIGAFLSQARKISFSSFCFAFGVLSIISAFF